MRCFRYNATISTATCLRKQRDAADKKYWGSNGEGYAPIHPCFKCEQGLKAKKGELSDMDVEEMSKGYQQDTKVPVKKCTKCGEHKPVVQFGTTKNTKDGLRSWCRECDAANTRARLTKAREAKKARKLEQEAGGSGTVLPKIKAEPVPIGEPVLRAGPETKEPVPVPESWRGPSYYLSLGGHCIPLCKDCMKRFLQGE